MAKGGKLTKLKSVLRKWNSFSKQSVSGSGFLRSNSNAIAATNHDLDDADYQMSEQCGRLNNHPVYVGKSRREYLISNEVLEHPLFQELVERSSGSGGGGSVVVVGCEVVMFEHLLWMLHNADPQPESLDELVDFYACC